MEQTGITTSAEQLSVNSTGKKPVKTQWLPLTPNMRNLKSQFITKENNCLKFAYQELAVVVGSYRAENPLTPDNSY